MFLAFLVSFFITASFIPLVIKFAKRFGMVDNPSIRPHPAHFHTEIIPRAGGLAIYLGIVITALVFLPLSKSLVGIVLGVTFLLSLGLIDDKLKEFNPYLRLGLLFLAAASAVFSGIGISFIANPLENFFSLPEPFNQQILRLDQVVIPFDFFGRHTIVVFADLLAFFWIVTLTQVINWSKGVDGQMPGITLIAGLSLGILSYRLFLQGDPQQLSVSILSFIVAGASLGFLIFNWYPAKILPGFSGSTILAFLLAVLAILSGAKLATASLTLAIPMIDFIYTFFRRVWQGRSPVWGDRGHLHHRLLDLGWGPRRISLFYMIGSAILGSVAIFVSSEGKFFALLVTTVTIFGFILWINSFGVLSKKSDPDNG